MSRLTRFARDEDGATLVEFAMVLAIFLLLVFGLIDFGRLGFTTVMAEKATEVAVRMAVVRPVLCDGVARVNQRGLIGTLSLDLPNGTPCTARNGLCRPAATVQCTGSLDRPGGAEIWAQVRPLLPVNATPAHLRFTYTFDADLNRVGAPYSPVVTVDLADLPFDFISPLGALAALAGAADDDLGQGFTLASMSASLPAEDLR